MQQNNRKEIFKQKRIPLLGEIIDTVFTAMPILSLVSLVSTIIILYETVKGYILNIFPWMNIWIFIIILIIVFIPILYIVYKYVILSVWNFRSTQMTPLEDKINKIDKKLDKILKEKDKDENSSSK